MYDIDEEALENADQNITLNEQNKDDFELILPRKRCKIEKKYSLVFANILQNVLLLESEYLANSLKPGGAIILSGLLKGQEVEVINTFESKNPNLKFQRVLEKGDWVAVLMVSN